MASVSDASLPLCAVYSAILTLLLPLRRVFLCTGPELPERVHPSPRSLRRRLTRDLGCFSSGRREPGLGPGPLLLRRPRSSRSRHGNRFSPLREAERDAVVIGDSIVRHVHTTTAKGKVRSHCFPGARVLDVAVQVPTILNGAETIGAVVLHAGVNDTGLWQTEVLKQDFRSLIETVRATSPATRIIVSGPLPTYRRGHERLFRADGLHPSRIGADLLSENISKTLRTV
ncbi:uncharacterized protein LOC125244383 [Megalobrama amblycephala]|uniref:uncharacterized protein LOC125244383 n=1 Tax=Megalobrama amblycephala TaxID=75352 RepID=UPI002014515E|nr:uncharacterized protein LOC125244383 [Megalobrama amblycephala]